MDQHIARRDVDGVGMRVRYADDTDGGPVFRWFEGCAAECEEEGVDNGD